MHTFVPNDFLDQLLDISSKNIFLLFTFHVLKTLNLEFSCIKKWFTDRSSQPLEIEVKKNISFLKCSMMGYSIKSSNQISVMGYCNLSFAKNMTKNIGKI